MSEKDQICFRIASFIKQCASHLRDLDHRMCGICEVKVTSSNCFLSPTNSAKHKVISFPIIDNNKLTAHPCN